MISLDMELTFNQPLKANGTDNTRLIGSVGRVFSNDPGDLGSIPCLVKPKTLKMVLDVSLLNNQQFKVSIEGIVEQTRERSSVFPYTSV